MGQCSTMSSAHSRSTAIVGIMVTQLYPSPNGSSVSGIGVHRIPKRPGMTRGIAAVGSILLVYKSDEVKAKSKSGCVEPGTMRPNVYKKSRLESPSRGITTRVDGNGVSA